jgi:hypothetical protein
MLHPASSPQFYGDEQCDQTRRDRSSTEQRRELVNMKSATGQRDKRDFCIHGTVDEIKSSPQWMRAERQCITNYGVECVTADCGGQSGGRSVR